MSVTYTRVLWRNGAITAGGEAGPTVPSDQLWVVRHALLFANVFGPYGVTMDGITVVEDLTGVVIAAVGQADAVAQRSFHFEMHQVLNPDDQLHAYTGSDGWSIALSGFIFAAP